MSTQNKLTNLGRNLCASFTNPAMVRTPKLYAQGQSNLTHKAGVTPKPAP
jgi:hypothetical protein